MKPIKLTPAQTSALHRVDRACGLGLWVHPWTVKWPTRRSLIRLGLLEADRAGDERGPIRVTKEGSRALAAALPFSVFSEIVAMQRASNAVRGGDT